VCSKSQDTAGRRHPGAMQVTCRTWIRWVKAAEGRYPGDSRRWLHSPVSSQARLTPASHMRIPGGGGGPGPSRGPMSRADGRPGAAFAHPWATARPSDPVTVTHHLVAGLRAKAPASALESAASSGPNPATSPGESDQPSHVESGNTRFTDPRNAGPGARLGREAGAGPDAGWDGLRAAGENALAPSSQPIWAPGGPQARRLSRQEPNPASPVSSAAAAGPPGPPASAGLWASPRNVDTSP